MTKRIFTEARSRMSAQIRLLRIIYLGVPRQAKSLWVSCLMSSLYVISHLCQGMPLYGRGFEQTAGIRQPYNGVSGLFVLLCQYLESKLSTLRSARGHGGQGMSKLSFQCITQCFHVHFSVYDYKVLPFAGATVIEESDNVASYSYDSAKQELISYDTPNIVKTKAEYINSNGMAVRKFAYVPLIRYSISERDRCFGLLIPTSSVLTRWLGPARESWVVWTKRRFVQTTLKDVLIMKTERQNHLR